MERLTPLEAVGLLKEQGLEVTAEQAILILEIVYVLAGIAIAQCLREEANKLKQAG